MPSMPPASGTVALTANVLFGCSRWLHLYRDIAEFFVRVVTAACLDLFYGRHCCLRCVGVNCNGDIADGIMYIHLGDVCEL